MNIRTLLVLSALVVSTFISDSFATKEETACYPTRSGAFNVCFARLEGEPPCPPGTELTDPEIDPSSLRFTDLGRITITKSATIEVSQEPGQRIAYRFIPTAGLTAGRTINVILENEKQPAGTSKAGLSAINIYTQRPGQPATSWTLMLKIRDFIDRKATITLKEDGTIIASDPRTKKQPFTIKLI